MAFTRSRIVASKTIAVCVLSAGTASIVKGHVAEITPIHGRSMSPSLSPNTHETGQRDWLLWQKGQPTRDLKHGDVVLFHSPSQPETVVAKRIIATGGDVVTLDPKRQPGYGVGMQELHPEHIAALERWHSYGGKLTVPFGHVWVEGDNWRDSRDSNDYGPVSKSLIIGKAWMALWPWNRAFTRPWEDFKSKTKVVHAPEVLPRAWRDD